MLLRRNLRVELLEDRWLLAVLIVNDLGDGSLAELAGDGKLSLREAVAAANGDVSVDGSVAGDGADVIEFDPALFAAGPQSVVLTGGQISVTASLNVNGPGASLLTIDASGNDPTPFVDDAQGSRIFLVSDDNFEVLFDFGLSGASLTGGDAGAGGAIATTENLALSDCVIFDNSSNIARGGAIDATGSEAHPASMLIVRSDLRDNRGNGGGAIHAHYQHKLLVEESSIVENTSSWKGGGFDIWHVELTIVRSLVASNKAGGDGGGIVGEDSTIYLTDSTISSNYSDKYGGGIAQMGGGVMLHLLRTSIVANQAKIFGGGIVGCSIAASCSIIAGNIVSRESWGYDFWNSGFTNANSYYSVIGSPVGTALTSAPVGSPDAHGNVIGDLGTGRIDPLLSPLADNGGRFSTHLPLAGSPAINMGDPAALAGEGDVPLNDSRGLHYLRVVGGRIDVGAVERQTPPADFDNDGDADGADFLAWQRGFGKVAPDVQRSDGDADADADVDAGDLDIWKETFGAAGGVVVEEGLAIALAATMAPAKPQSAIRNRQDLVDLAVANWHGKLSTELAAEANVATEVIPMEFVLENQRSPNLLSPIAVTSSFLALSFTGGVGTDEGTLIANIDEIANSLIDVL